MKEFFACILLVLVGRRVECGTRGAHPGEEGQALAIWTKYCSNGGDGGVLDGGSIFVHCKHPLTPEARTLQARVVGQVEGPEKREQIIFVQPPTLNFQHELKVLGGETLEPKTIVYVKPSKSTHRYSANIKVAESEHKKPELVFLNSNGDQQEDVKYVARDDGQSGTSENHAVVGNGDHTVIRTKDRSVEVDRQLSKRQIVPEHVEQRVLYSKPYSSVRVVG